MQTQMVFRSASTATMAGGRRCARAPTAARPVPRCVRVRAWEDEEEEYQRQPLNQWPDPDFTARVLEAFPEQGLANVEEARVLYESGWTYLDTRSEFECDESGKIKGAVNVPYVTIKRVYDPETQARVIKKTDNPDFVKMVEKKFPNKSAAKLLVGCSNGKAYSLDVLEMLEEAGYENLVWLKGGYNAWYNTFDNKLKRRVYGEYAETYMHDGDSCGIHASGAGFARVDAIERITLPVY